MQLLLTAAEWIGVAGHLPTPVNFLLHQRRIFQQSDDFIPNKLIQIILSDRAVRAHRPFEPTIPIRTQAAVVVEEVLGSSSGASVQRVAAWLALSRFGTPFRWRIGRVIRCRGRSSVLP